MFKEQADCVVIGYVRGRFEIDLTSRRTANVILKCQFFKTKKMDG